MSSFIFPSEKTLYHYVQVPLVTMREKPSLSSKVVSQALFSEQVSIIDKHNSWFYISTPDGYMGWLNTSAVISLEERYTPSISTTRLECHLYIRQDIEYGPYISLPFGSNLEVVEDTKERWLEVRLPKGEYCFIQRGDVTLEIPINKKEDLVKFSKQFLGLPYTWGGRSSYGYDCSGFIQMLYKMIHINLPRDSHQQVNDCRLQNCPLHQLEPGDLLFFGKSEKQIQHVGLYLGNSEFIHATAREYKPWIRISSLSDLEWSGQDGVYYPYRVGRKLGLRAQLPIL